MTAKHLRRSAAAVAAAAIVGLVAVGAQPATAAQTQAKHPSSTMTSKAMRPAATPSRARRSSVRRALVTTAGKFPSIAVVRGPNRVVYATTGSGYVNLGGQVTDDPAVAATPDQLWFLGKGTNGLLYLRTADTGWQLVQNSPSLGTGLTAASSQTGGLYFTYLDGNFRVHLGTIDPAADLGPIVTADITGPSSYGAAVSITGEPLYIGPDTTPGLLGTTGNLMRWSGGDPADPAHRTKLYLSCARDRLATARNTFYPDGLVGAVACRSADWTSSVNFLGTAGAHNLGGHIIGSPGIALRTTDEVDSIIYVTGTNHMVYSTSISDLTLPGGPDLFSSTPFLNLGGYASGGVQATAFTLTLDAGPTT